MKFICSELGKVREVRKSVSSELLMCGGGVRSIWPLPLMARCLKKKKVCVYDACLLLCPL